MDPDTSSGPILFAEFARDFAGHFRVETSAAAAGRTSPLVAVIDDLRDKKIMTNTQRTILVTGATGKQGGAVISHMLSFPGFGLLRAEWPASGLMSWFVRPW